MTFQYSSIMGFCASFLLTKQRVLTALDAKTQKKRESMGAREGTLVSAAQQATAKIRDTVLFKRGRERRFPLIAETNKTKKSMKSDVTRSSIFFFDTMQRSE